MAYIHLNVNIMTVHLILFSLVLFVLLWTRKWWKWRVFESVNM